MVGGSPANCNLYSKSAANRSLRRRTVVIGSRQFSPGPQFRLVAPQTRPMLESQQSTIPEENHGDSARFAGDVGLPVVQSASQVARRSEWLEVLRVPQSVSGTR